VPPGEVPGFLALHAELAARLAARGYPYIPYDDAAEAADRAEPVAGGELAAATEG